MNNPTYQELLELLAGHDGNIGDLARKLINQAGNPEVFEQLDGQPPRRVLELSNEFSKMEKIDFVDEYMDLAVVTLSQRVRDSWKETMLNAGTGLASEGGEINEIIKKHFFHFHPMDADMIKHLRKETGDILWYVMLLCWAMDWFPSTILAENIAKLKARYPEGFDPEKSMHRVAGDI